MCWAAELGILGRRGPVCTPEAQVQAAWGRVLSVRVVAGWPRGALVLGRGLDRVTSKLPPLAWGPNTLFPGEDSLGRGDIKFLPPPHLATIKMFCVYEFASVLFILFLRFHV